MKFKYAFFILFAFLVWLIFFGWRAYEASKSYEHHSFELLSYQDLESIASHKVSSLAEEFTFGLYESDSHAFVTTLQTITTERNNDKDWAERYTFFAMLPLFGMLGSYFFVSLRVFVIFNALSALVLLGVGLNAPIMSMTIHKEVAYLGDVILSFESKSVIGSIEKLWENGEIVIALVIFLFSVALPTLKTLFLLFVSVVSQSDFAHKVVKFFKTLGKWSMLDVFVVAIFLVYLTSNSSDVSRAEAQVGLYFFLAYVAVSIVVSLGVDKMLTLSKQNKLPNKIPCSD